MYLCINNRDNPKNNIGNSYWARYDGELERNVVEKNGKIAIIKNNDTAPFPNKSMQISYGLVYISNMIIQLKIYL